MAERMKRILFFVLLVLVTAGAVLVAANTATYPEPGSWLEGETPLQLPLGSMNIHLPLLAFGLALGWSAVLTAWELCRGEVRLHRIALIFILGAGVMISLCKPAIQMIDWDAGTHRNHVSAFAGLEGYDMADYLAHFNTWFFGYIPYTVGMAMGKLLNVGDAWTLRMGFLCGTVIFALMASQAVKHAPRYKLTFLGVACLPTCVMIATNVSYDGTVIYATLLALTLLLEEIHQPEKLLSGSRAFAMAGLLTMGTLPKPAYSLGLMLLWLLPEGKFASKGRKWAFRLFVLLLLLLCMASMALGMYDDILPGDERMDNTDSAGQIAWILGNPGSFLGMLGAFLAEEFTTYFPDAMAAWGLWGSDVAWVGYMLLACLVLVCSWCTLGEKDGAPLLPCRRRTALAVWGFLPLLGLMVVQYIVSTPVAHETIDGMQPRYILPVIIMLLLCIAPAQQWRSKAKPAARWIALVVMIVLFVAMYGGAWRMIMHSIHLL